LNTVLITVLGMENVMKAFVNALQDIMATAVNF
jgi:hypothetical protein